MIKFRQSMTSGGELDPDDEVVSGNGNYDLVLHADGGLVLYDLTRGEVGDANASIWHCEIEGKSASKCVMQPDGNLVILDSSGPIWDSGTHGHSEAYLNVQDDGRVVIYQPEPHQALWAKP